MDDYYGKNLFGEKVVISLDDGKDDEIDSAGKDDKRFNIFLLTDAIAARDKRNAWIIYRKAISNGLVADEIFWRVVWGIKSLLLASKTQNADESGLNPFVYKKNKNLLKNWKEEELENLLGGLVCGYHDVRRGVGDMENFLERTILEL